MTKDPTNNIRKVWQKPELYVIDSVNAKPHGGSFHEFHTPNHTKVYRKVPKATGFIGTSQWSDFAS